MYEIWREVLLGRYRAQGRNFLTPTVLKVRTGHEKVVELSEGEGFDRKPIWGVTVFVFKPDGTRDYENVNPYHGCYHDKQEAQIAYLKA